MSEVPDGNSAPSAMLADVMPAGNAYVRHTFQNVVPTKTRLAMDIKILDPIADAGAPDGGQVKALWLATTTVRKDSSAYAALALDPNGLALSIVPLAAYPLGPPPVVNVWVRYEVEITWASSGAGGAITAWVDGTKVLEQTNVSTTDGNPTDALNFTVGLRSNQGIGFRAEYDNVTFDY